MLKGLPLGGYRGVGFVVLIKPAKSKIIRKCTVQESPPRSFLTSNTSITYHMQQVKVPENRELE